MIGIIYGIVSLLFIFWIVGLILHIGVGLIHIVLAIALVLLAFNVITGRGARV